MFNIQEFKKNGLIYEGARPSLFQFILSSGSMGGISLPTAQLNQLQFVTRSASLPASAIDSIDVPYFGRKIKVAGDRNFGDYSVTIMNDEDFAIREMFEAWHNSINSIESNIRNPILGTGNYKVDFQVRQFSKTGDVIRSYKMIGAFPTLVSPIDLDWDQQNSIEVFSVVFAYDYWLPDEQDAVNTVISYYNEATTPISI